MTSPASRRVLSSGISLGLTLLFAVAGGIAIGNLYLTQPLLTVIVNDIGAPTGTAGLFVTITQIGYALGIVLIVPLGDCLNRRRLVPAAMVLSAVALALASQVQSFLFLLASLGAVGVFTTAGQLITPLTADLALPEQRGRAVATVVSGMLSGILLSRVLSGFIGDIFGWRAVLLLAAIIAAAMAVLLWLRIPEEDNRSRMAYGDLFSSIVRIVRSHTAVRATLVIGTCVFAVFSMFWTGLTFLLSEAPFNYSLSQIGLVGIAGLAGAVAAKNAGRLHDTGLSYPAQGICLAVTLASLAVAGIGAHSILAVLATAVFLDGAIQSINVLNQLRLMSVAPSSRSSINAAFVTCNFAGGAVGSAFAGFLWPVVGWTGIMIAAAMLVLVALFAWTWSRRAITTLMAPVGEPL